MKQTNKEFLEDYSAPYARAVIGLTLIGSENIPGNITGIRKQFQNNEIKVNVNESAKPFIVSELQNIALKSMEDLGALLHVLNKNDNYCVDYINPSTTGVWEVGNVYKKILETTPQFDGNSLGNLVHLDHQKLEMESNKDDKDILSYVAEIVLDCAKNWFHQAPDNIETIEEVLGSWDANALYVGAYIGNEDTLSDNDKKNIVKTNKALYNKTKHRFCRLTKKMIEALNEDGVSNTRRIKINIDDTSVKELINYIIDITSASDLIGSLVLEYSINKRS